MSLLNVLINIYARFLRIQNDKKRHERRGYICAEQNNIMKWMTINFLACESERVFFLRDTALQQDGYGCDGIKMRSIISISNFLLFHFAFVLCFCVFLEFFDNTYILRYDKILFFHHTTKIVSTLGFY